METKPKIKVAFCTYDDPTFVGGPNTWLRRLLPELQQAGIESQVLLFIKGLKEDCPCYIDLHNQGFTCHTFPWESTTQQRIRWILSTLAQNPPHIFIPHMLVPAFYASRWVKQVGIPTVGVMHADDEFYWAVLKEFIFGEPTQKLSALVCVSQFLTAKVNSLAPTSSVIKQIPCGVPIPQQIAQPPQQCMRLIYVGRFVEEQKQISQVTSALCRAVKEVANTEAIIYGDGPEKAKVETIISQEGQKLPIRLAGFVDNTQIQTIMQQAHVLVLLSDYEGLPIALMEAMACGVVPICMQMRSGIPELVQHEITGLIVNNRSDEFVTAVQRLRNEADLWQKLSASAHAKIASTYSSEVSTNLWVSLISELYCQSKTNAIIKQPLFINLPPINKVLAKEDFRPQNLFKRVLTKASNLCKKLT